MTNRQRRTTADLLEVPAGVKSKNHSTPSGLRAPNESMLHVSEIHARSLAQISLNNSEDLSGHFKVPGMANSSNPTHNATTSSTSLIPEVLRAKKLITINYEMNEEKLKIKERMLQQLQSIDLTKYSFPNEHKPKTEYTYANTYSDYLKEPKSLIDENQVEMPNLCRRSRRSPNVSACTSNVSNTVAQDLDMSIVDRLKDNTSQVGRALTARLSFLEYFKT